jgi:DNA polymerase-1
VRNPFPSVRNEQKLTKTLFKSEKRGILIDVEYTKEALAYEEEMRDEYAAKFYAYTGEEYQDAPSLFKIVFKKLGLTPGKTPKGNDSYSEENLPDNAVTELILGWRKHNKRAVTYFRGFLDLVDKDGVIHCNFKQDGTVTGRMSSTNPNLQNVPKRGEDESKYPVRKCFVPREGYVFAMLDYQAQEYRLLLDIANEKEVIRKIMEDGLDVHTATAEEMGTDRTAAKTLNFMLLYGGGAAKLASALSIAVTKAKQLKQKYFTSLRSVSGLVEALTTTAKRRGYVVNWFGRRILLDEERSYTVPNHYIQGGCADITKLALNNVDCFLEKTTSHVLLQIHDELVYEINRKELNIIPTLIELMEEVYPFTTLPMEAEADVGENLYEKETYIN